MKKKILLSMVASSIVATSAMAGTITSVTGSTLKETNVSLEWVKSQNIKADVNISEKLGEMNITFDSIKYNPLSNPVVNMTFTGAKAVVDNNKGLDKVYICKLDANGSAADAPAVLVYNNVYNNVVSFKAVNKDRQVSNGFSYGFFTDVNESNCSDSASSAGFDPASKHVTASNLLAVSLDPANPQTVGVDVVLASGDSQEKQDEAVYNPIVSTVKQFCAGVNNGVQNSIDPLNDFLSFNTSSTTCLTASNCSSKAKLSDSIEIKLRSNIGGCITNTNYEINQVIGNYKVVASQSLPLNKDKTTVDKYTIGTFAINESNNEFVWQKAISGLASANAANLSTLTLTVNGTEKIPVTSFEASLSITTNDPYAKGYSENLMTNKDAGTWKYAGSDPMTIPYVVSSADTKTAIRVVNNGNSNGIAYWDCTDDNGVTVANLEVAAADTKSSEIKAGGAAAWLARDILAAAQAENPDFAPNGKMKCKVMVTNDGTDIDVVPVMTINGARDRVINTHK